MVATCIHNRISLLHSRTHLSKTPKLPHTKSLNGRTNVSDGNGRISWIEASSTHKDEDSCIKVERHFLTWLLHVVQSPTEHLRFQSHHLRDSNAPKLPQYKVAHLVKNDFLYYNTDNDWIPTLSECWKTLCHPDVVQGRAPLRTTRGKLGNFFIHQTFPS
jgi:hypothetical protein